ncbi:hypothetical protein [Streptomyces pini]|uniref:Uncharacterized protein n=1 Tax=Streptomyces pini TaxID=1520580 RepID=A0A1I4BW08_9ACTN|nr:hypothetical protein [Streptomyces pini]SFK72962.1 hypothetical protein SAMN05192584_108162 [Streptomyces pini]
MTYDVLDVLGDEPEAVEADLMRHYPGYGPGGPLAAFWQRRISLRLLRVMVENLPPDGATARAQAGHDWRHVDYAAENVVDLLAQFVTDFRNAHRDPDKPALPYPERGWRPGDPLPEETAEDAEHKRDQARTAYQRITAQVLPGKG